MRTPIFLFMLLMVLGTLPQPLRAQMSQKSLSTRQTADMNNPTSPEDEQACLYFENTEYSRAFTKNVPDPAFTNLDTCANSLDSNIPTAVAISANKAQAIADLKSTYQLTSQDQVDEELSTTHYLCRVLRRWANLDKSGAETPQLAILDSLDARVHSLMAYEGLLDPFAGSLVAGPIIGQTGKQSSGTTAATGGTGTTTTPATTTGSNTNPLVHVEWGSEHFLSESWSPVDFGFGGSFGLQPALTLLTAPPPASGTPIPASSITSQYQSAFVWDLNGNANLHTGSTAETSAFFRAGQVRLLSGNGATIVNQGTNSILEIPLNGNADSMSWFYETGIQFNYYSKVLEVVHAEKGQLDPTFKIGISYKIDTRFAQNAGVVGFTSPDRRLVARFMINGLKIFDRRPNTTPSKPYTISFGVDYERGFGATPVPSGTSLIIRGDIDLLKLINPGSGS
jgi:hypothetical protein